jgi:methyltransferase (TIGR00027 family)
MQSEKPSRTARAAAIHRAAHQVLEQGRIFADPLAFRILGEDPESIVREAEEHPTGRRMRIFIAARTRFAEDALAAAFEGGVRQLVLLGAGLDTYAYRSHLSADGLHIFEVDHPATQVWKCQRLADAGIPIPKSLRFVSIDFERQSLAERLAASALDRTKQTFFSWLGVVPYLAEAAVERYFPIGESTLPDKGGHILRATKSGSRR